MQHRLVVTLALFAAIVTATSPASAEAPGRVEPTVAPIIVWPTPVDVINKSYGLHVLAADAALATAALGLDNPDLIWGFAVSGSVVHAAHGNWGRAGVSAGLRIGMPILGAIAGHMLQPNDRCSGDVCEPSVGAPLGAITGFATALILDWTVVSREREYVPRQSWSQRFTPTAAIGKSGVRLGLGGSF